MRFRFFAWVIVRSNSSSPQLCVFFFVSAQWTVDTHESGINDLLATRCWLLTILTPDKYELPVIQKQLPEMLNTQPIDLCVVCLSILSIEEKTVWWHLNWTRIFFWVISTTFSCFMVPTVWFIERIIAEWNPFYCLTVTNLLSFLRYRNCI